MQVKHLIWSLIAVTALSLVVFAAPQSTATAGRNVPRTATVGVVTTREFRVAVVATRMGGENPPTAEVRVGLARRVRSSWREFGERRLGETYFWNTVSRPHAICRLAIETVGTRRASGSQLVVRLLLTPSLGCGRTYRIPLPTR